MTYLADYNSRFINIVEGDGCFLFDDKGKKYLDFIAGWCVGNIGWKRKEIKEAVLREAEFGRFVPAFLRFRGQEDFAALLSNITPNKKLTRVFRCTSGSEAVEFAIKCARVASGKKIIISVDGVYHGHTYGAASVGDACYEGMAPCIPGFLKIAMPRNEEEAEMVMKKFGDIVKENSGDVAAFMSEPVWTNGGAVIPPKNFYPAIEKICRENDILIVMDEVATGFGRCGVLFASELWGIKPDIMCLAKGFTGGYATMGACLVTEEIFERSRYIPSYSTFGWCVSDLAATRANVEVILKDKLWENSKIIGEYLLSKLKEFEKLDYVKEVRGKGLLLGIEIVHDKESGRPDYKRAQRIQDECADKGLLIETAGNALFITPPLILTKELADKGFEILKQILK